MADTVTITRDAKLELYFVDGDTRTQTIKDSKPANQISNISQFNDFLQQSNILIGDKSGATFGRINKVSVITRKTTSLDTA